MKIPVVWYPHDRITCSAAAMLNEMFDCSGVEHYHGFGELPMEAQGAVIVFHGQQVLNPQSLARLATELDWIIFVSIGDEGCYFPYHLLQHKNTRLWIQTPKPERVRADRYLIEGYPANCHEMLGKVGDIPRDLSWFFAGQITHDRRKEFADSLWNCPPRSIFWQTDGFGKGYSPEDYFYYMRRSKIVPCPAGPLTPDSFRFAEALEAGAVPILDAYAPDGVKGYWEMVLGSHPFHVVEDWATLPKVMEEILRNFEYEQRLTQYWWKHYKLQMKTIWLAQDLIALGAK